MNVLDDPEIIENSDTYKVLSSINLFPKQALQVLSQAGQFEIAPLQKIENVVVVGMGGSGFAADIVKTAFLDKIKFPLEIVNDYYLPRYVNEKSLVVGSSYSGDTEEVLAAAQEALDKKAKVTGVTCGGKLRKILNRQNMPVFVFKEKFNPSGQPRLGVGYMVGGLVGLLIKLGVLDGDFSKIRKAIEKASEANIYKFDVPFRKNLAKQIASKLKDKFILLVTSDFLRGAIHGFANQLNETAKTNSTFHFIPEMDHHRLEGLQYPKNFCKNAFFVFYTSSLFDPRVKIRFNLTCDVIKKNGFEVVNFSPPGKNKLEQLFHTIIFNSYLSFYLALLYGVNPIKIPLVDYFKRELVKTNFSSQA